MELSYILATEVEALFLSGFFPQQIFAELAARYPNEDLEILNKYSFLNLFFVILGSK